MLFKQNPAGGEKAENQQTLFKRKQRVFQDSMGCLNVLQQTKKKEAEASLFFPFNLRWRLRGVGS